MLGFVSTLCPLVIALLVVKISLWIYRWGNPKCNGKLPPGSMGFLIIGETMEFLKLHDFNTIPAFFKERIFRYGPIFRTSLFGNKVIISADPEVNLELSKANESLSDGAFQSLRRIFGEKNLFLQSKVAHKYMRNLTFQLIGPEVLKRRLIQDVDLTTSKHMQRTARNGTFHAKEMAVHIVKECLAKKIMEDMEAKAAGEFQEIWTALPSEWFHFPINLPGTTLYKFIKARAKMMKLLKDVFHKNKRSKEGLGDLFATILEETEKESGVMDVEKAAEFLFTLLVLSQETTPSVIALTVKLISDHPKVLKELQKEHRGIVQNRADEKTGLTWEEYKSMSFTHMVINESLRISSTVPTLYRRTIRDIEIKGYTIPAGWFILGVPLVHFDPEKYKDPFTFNPWRWQGNELHASVSKTYMPFGGGPRLCVGAEFAKLQMATFIHHLSLYRWSMNKETTIVRRLFVKFPNGCNVEISEDV